MKVDQYKILAVKKENEKLFQEIIDQKTKPLGALGQLEALALKMALIQETKTITLSKPAMLVFAADHGIAQSGVSAYPSEVTAQMVLNFVRGGAAINVYCKENRMALHVVDAGVNYDFTEGLPIYNKKIGKGTKSFLNDKAMSPDQCNRAMLTGSDLVQDLSNDGCNTIAFGEMGIGNTSSASCLMHMVTGLSLEQCVGRGTGLSNEQYERKHSILQEAIGFHNLKDATALNILQTFGGFEIAMIVGAILEAAKRKMIIIIDQFHQKV